MTSDDPTARPGGSNKGNGVVLAPAEELVLAVDPSDDQGGRARELPERDEIGCPGCREDHASRIVDNDEDRAVSDCCFGVIEHEVKPERCGRRAAVISYAAHVGQLKDGGRG